MNTDQNATAPLDKTGAESTARCVVSDLKDAASQKFDEAVTEVRAKADDAKSDVAGDMNDVASALRRASEELRGGSAQERTLGQISSSLADASDLIRDKDLGEMAQMASKVARAAWVRGKPFCEGVARSRRCFAQSGFRRKIHSNEIVH